MLKKSVQQGRSKRRGEAYSVRYVEPLRAARTTLADFFSILLGDSRGLSFVKGESDPKRRTLVDGTLHSDGPAMFLDDTFDDRET